MGLKEFNAHGARRGTCCVGLVHVQRLASELSALVPQLRAVTATGHPGTAVCSSRGSGSHDTGVKAGLGCRTPTQMATHSPRGRQRVRGPCFLRAGQPGLGPWPACLDEDRWGHGLPQHAPRCPAFGPGPGSRQGDRPRGSGRACGGRCWAARPGARVVCASLVPEGRGGRTRAGLSPPQARAQRSGTAGAAVACGRAPGLTCFSPACRGARPRVPGRAPPLPTPVTWCG